jgi:hypothetical protein
VVRGGEGQQEGVMPIRIIRKGGVVQVPVKAEEPKPFKPAFPPEWMNPPPISSDKNAYIVAGDHGIHYLYRSNGVMHAVGSLEMCEAVKHGDLARFIDLCEAECRAKEGK